MSRGFVPVEFEMSGGDRIVVPIRNVTGQVELMEQLASASESQQRIIAKAIEHNREQIEFSHAPATREEAVCELQKVLDLLEAGELIVGVTSHR